MTAAVAQRLGVQGQGDAGPVVEQQYLSPLFVRLDHHRPPFPASPDDEPDRALPVLLGHLERLDGAPGQLGPEAPHEAVCRSAPRPLGRQAHTTHRALEGEEEHLAPDRRAERDGQEPRAWQVHAADPRAAYRFSHRVALCSSGSAVTGPQAS